MNANDPWSFSMLHTCPVFYLHLWLQHFLYRKSYDHLTFLFHYYALLNAGLSRINYIIQQASIRHLAFFLFLGYLVTKYAALKCITPSCWKHFCNWALPAGRNPVHGQGDIYRLRDVNPSPEGCCNLSLLCHYGETKQQNELWVGAHCWMIVRNAHCERCVHDPGCNWAHFVWGMLNSQAQTDLLEASAACNSN